MLEQKQNSQNEEMDKNADTEKKKVQHMAGKNKNTCPRWYQDFSFDQMKSLMMLQCLMNQDYEEQVVGRTQRTLISIGIISTFFTLAPDIIKQLQSLSNCNVIDFLREVYKILTGNYFEEEEYKTFYDCNERIILSSIAFLTLPEAVVELHKRLPPVIMPKLPRKPVPPEPPKRQRMESPYEEKLFVPQDWASYYNSLQYWQRKCQLIPIPKVILPPKDCILTNYKRIDFGDEENRIFNLTNVSQNNQSESVKYNPVTGEEQKKKVSIGKKSKYDDRTKVNINGSNSPTLKPLIAKENGTSVNAPNINFPTMPGSSNVTEKNENIVDNKNGDNKNKGDKNKDNKNKNNKNKDNKNKGDKNKDSKNKDNKNKDNKNKDNKNGDNTSGEDTEESMEENSEQEVVKCTEDLEKSVSLNVQPLYGKNRLFDFTINGISERSGPVEYKLCGTLQPPHPNKKSWLGEKHAHFIISGAADEPPTCPVTYEVTGVANVTPSNSNERFFAVLNLGDGPNKIYPSGRENLSRHWQEWLQSVDEEFRNVEREANRIVKSIEAVTKLVFPDPTCDSCCSCRQTRKSYLKAKETKAPYFVIDTISEDNKKNKYIIGSMAMHSPAATPPESTVNLLEFIASEDVLTSNIIINGVKSEKGDTQYFITGIRDDLIHMPRRVIERPPPPPPRNVPPCVCAIQQMSNKDVTPTLSHDNIPWTKDEGLCFGKKFRPDESGAYSCKKYPGDKSCRRNPFRREIMRRKKRAERALQEQKDPSEKKMYSIADFKPCGDEHGMGVCGAPWGTVHVLSPEELAEQEKLRKEILKGPPCGTKPGRAICAGPFGRRVSIKRQKIIAIEGEEPGEEDLEDEEDLEEEEEKEKETEPVKKEKEKKRDQSCFGSPDAIAARQKVMEEKMTKKFVPDLTYPGYDDPWNIHRTAPTKDESETDFKQLLKLSSPKPPATPVPSKTSIAASEKHISDTNIKKDNLKVSGGGSEKLTSGQTSKKLGTTKTTSDTKIDKKRSKSTSRKETQIGAKRASEETIQSDKIESHKLPSPGKNKQTTSVKHLKEENKLHQEDKTSKPTVESTKSKFKREKTSSVSEKSRSKFGSETKINKKTTGKSDINGSKKHGIKVSASHGQFSRKTERKPSSVRNIEMNKSNRKEETRKQSSQRLISSASAKKKSTKRDKKKDAQAVHEVDSETLRKNEIENLKNMLKSPDIYPHDIKPVTLPEEPATKCQLEYEYPDSVDNSIKIDEAEVEQIPNRGPCGWRTKSEQKLPTKKTLVYLSEPDYPPETIPVRPGGKPCLCRENRATKKILMYNIGGLIPSKKEEKKGKLFKRKKSENEKNTQVIDGVIYYTPPPSPRRSDEYVPEYDLYKSPYDMCQTKRKDKSLKILERYSIPKEPKGFENQESCGCNEFIDTYGIQNIDHDNEKAQRTKEFDKIREEFINAKPPEERWKLALNDVGLIDYFTRCRDSMPCWLKCAKLNKVGCSLPYPKLQTKRPVCECKYERKILENDEEKVKWKERQKKLKSYKKQPFVNVADISKPMVANTKLMISGVKRIPREDEYIDDVQYCITGVAENYSESPPQQVLGGVHMSTPIQTPKPSTDSLPCVCLHKHWSAIDVPPGPLPKPEEILLAEKKRRQQAVIEAFKQIYAPEKIYDTHDGHSCEASCMEESETENGEVINENNKAVVQTDDRNKTSYAQKPMTMHKGKSVKQKQQQQQLKLSNKKKNIPDIRNIVTQETTENVIRSNEMRNDNVQLQNESANLNMENVNASDEVVEEDFLDSEDQFMIVVQVELKKMATEGFLFAKLPKCLFMPQLQYWLMYRKGFVLSDEDRKKTVTKSILTWNLLDVAKSPIIKPPSLELTKRQIRSLTFDNASEMKKKIAMKKAIFYSQVRKNRVLYARTMWNTMEYGKFPSASFKQAYFTYMASKEADGFVFKPWLPFEGRK